jgi:hypothetical protein
MDRLHLHTKRQFPFPPRFDRLAQLRLFCFCIWVYDSDYSCFAFSRNFSRFTPTPILLPTPSRLFQHFTQGVGTHLRSSRFPYSKTPLPGRQTPCCRPIRLPIWLFLDSLKDLLVFPASGKVNESSSQRKSPSRFHSIGFPSEWERAESKIPSRQEF